MYTFPECDVPERHLFEVGATGKYTGALSSFSARQALGDPKTQWVWSFGGLNYAIFCEPHSSPSSSEPVSFSFWKRRSVTGKSISPQDIRFFYTMVRRPSSDKNASRLSRDAYTAIKRSSDAVGDLCKKRGYCTIEVLKVGNTYGLVPSALQLARVPSSKRTFAGIKELLCKQYIVAGLIACDSHGVCWRVDSRRMSRCDPFTAWKKTGHMLRDMTFVKPKLL